MVVIKSRSEIDGIRKSSQLAAAALQFAGTLVKAGVTTLSINNAVALFIRERGAKSACLGYPGLNNVYFPREICISINNEVCHGIPSGRILRDGDIVKIDVTTILDKYFGDTCATFVVGKTSPIALNLIETTKQSMMLGIQQIKPGIRSGIIGFTINQFINKQGYSVVYEYAGHGVGLSFHEEPQIMHVSATDTGVLMRPGMIFTVEPMINVGEPRTMLAKDGWTALTVDGSLSAQFEHTILVTKDGYEILTAV